MKSSPIVVIGGGSIGQRHIKNLKHLGYKNICCLKREHDQDFEIEFGVKVITDSISLIEIQPLAVFICNPTSMHINSLEDAVKSGAHIFMEKPLIHDKEGLEKAEQILTDYPKVFFIGFMMRYHPLVKEILKIVNSEELGKVYSARFEFGSYLPYWHPYEDHRTSYASRKELGGGVINTITHELDLIQYFFGNPLEVNAFKMNLGKLDIEVEELFEGSLKYDDKIITLHLDYLQKDYDRRISILCDEGSIRWNWHENEVVVSKHKEDIKKIPLSGFDVNQLYLDELSHFFQLIQDQLVDHSLNHLHAIENTKITLALHEAAESSKTVIL